MNSIAYNLYAGVAFSPGYKASFLSVYAEFKSPRSGERAYSRNLKADKDCGDLKSYRAISLLCVSYKIFQRLIYAQVEPNIDPCLIKNRLVSDARSQPRIKSFW